MTTFVTCFIDLEKEDEPCRNLRFDQFTDIAKTGINICVYADVASREYLLNITGRYENVQQMRSLSIDDLFAHKVISSSFTAIHLPYTDNIKKDTREFMILMNSKIELVKDAMDNNTFPNSHCFAWIDFNISKIFSSTDYIDLLRNMKDSAPDCPFLAIPGCWCNADCKTEQIIQSIYWRFCGGFFGGHRESLKEFYDLYVHYFPMFISQYNTLVWEVNFWAWLECNSAWSPQWYLANHDDSILQVPYSITSMSIKSRSSMQVYDYPQIVDNGVSYVPSSASYIKFDGKHILNTRYVNYTMDHENFYCHNLNGLIITKNMTSTLDEHLRPIDYVVLDDPYSETAAMCMFNGIEDIRLYEKKKSTSLHRYQHES
jgi:hypothetical protein